MNGVHLLWMYEAQAQLEFIDTVPLQECSVGKLGICLMNIPLTFMHIIPGSPSLRAVL